VAISRLFNSYRALGLGKTLSCQPHLSSHPLRKQAVHTGFFPSHPVFRARHGLQVRRSFRRRTTGSPVSAIKGLLVGSMACSFSQPLEPGKTLSCQSHLSSHPLREQAVHTGFCPSHPVFRARHGLQARRIFRRRTTGSPVSGIKGLLVGSMACSFSQPRWRVHEFAEAGTIGRPDSDVECGVPRCTCSNVRIERLEISTVRLGNRADRSGCVSGRSRLRTLVSGRVSARDRLHHSATLAY